MSSRRGPETSRRDSTEGLSLSRLAGLPTDYWSSAKQEVRDKWAREEKAKALTEDAILAPIKSSGPGAAAAEASLQEMIISLEGLDEEELYHEILIAEEKLLQGQESRRESEATLRAELSKIYTEVQSLQQSARELRINAEELTNDSESHIKIQIEIDQIKRQIVAARRGVQATDFFCEKAKKQHAARTSARHQRDVQARASTAQKQKWQEVIGSLNNCGARIEQLEQEKKDLAIMQKQTATKMKQNTLLDESEIEFRALMDRQAKLLKELNESRNAQELKKLLEEERREFKSKRATSTVVLEEIAELEESTDIIERRCQRCVDELKDSLLRSAGKETDLHRQKAQMDEWLQSMWSTICQQKREQLLLHQRMQEEDMWSSHLQKRTDQLVDELTKLEEDVQDIYDEFGDPHPDEEKLEEEMWADLQLIRQKRRAAQHKLAYHLSRRRPLAEAMDRYKKEHRELKKQLAPIQSLLNEL